MITNTNYRTTPLRKARYLPLTLVVGFLVACSPQSSQQNADYAEVGWDAALEGVIEQRDGCLVVDGSVLVIQSENGPEFGVGDWVRLGGGWSTGQDIGLNCDVDGDVFFVHSVDLVREDGVAP